MGYTNYWTNKRAFTDDEWKRVKDEYEWLKEMGEGIIIDQTKLTSEIVFNGNPKDEQDHETFYINKANVYDGFNFCKTARKPYDAVVATILVGIKKIAPKKFSARADGSLRVGGINKWSNEY